MTDEQEVKYTARVAEVVKSAPGCWDTLRIEVLLDDKVVGEYMRDYSAFYNTFFPFARDGQWYALYSPSYTGTRIMRLPECVDIGGEEICAFGFCPVDYLVPTVTACALPADDPKPRSPRQDRERWAEARPIPGGVRYIWPDSHDNTDEGKRRLFLEECQAAEAALASWYARHPLKEEYADFGFVAGCVWGDDHSWKLEFLDLSGVKDGVLKRDARFGYLELPAGLGLAEAVRVREHNAYVPYSRDNIDLEIAVCRRFDINGYNEEDDRV